MVNLNDLNNNMKLTDEQVTPLKSDIRRVDFAKTALCSGCNPVSCFINGVNIPVVGNWRDLLASVTEYCIENYSDKTERLKLAWFSNYSDNPYLLTSKPLRDSKKLSTGHWISVHYSISQLVLMIAGLCRYCGINLNNVVITYTPKTNAEVSRNGTISLNENSSTQQPQSIIMPNVPDPVIKVLIKDYHNGFAFDTTAIRLLSDKSGIDVDDGIQSALKCAMFRRSDDVCFLLDVVANAEIQKEIVDCADALLNDHGCFEISVLYAFFADSLNEKCVGGLKDFESFYEFLNKRDVRCVTSYGTRIARVQSKSIHDLSVDITKKIIAITHDEYGGVIREDDLRNRFPAFSATLLASIIKEHAEELVKTEINGIVCYQTLDALGLSDEFSDILAETLSKLDNLGLPLSEDVLHTALSIRLGVNFKAEYNIPDDKTYRRLLAVYYKGAPKREWKRGIFAEVPD